MKKNVGLIATLLACCSVMAATAQNKGKNPSLKVVCSVLAADIKLTAHMDGGDKTASLGSSTVPLKQGMRYTLNVSKPGYSPYRKSLHANWEGLRQLSIVLEEGIGPDPSGSWVVDLEDSITIEFVPIPTGSFIMGSEDGEDDEQPVRPVSFSRPFWMAKTEITQQQYGQFKAPPETFKKKDIPMPMSAVLPVAGISWSDAMEYCNWLTENERMMGRLPEGYEYTLPTEAEWEYACRAGSTGDYAGDIGSMGWFNKNSSERTNPVASKNANAWGLYDMHGNVWEWCADSWYANYENAPTDGSQRGLALNEYRVPSEQWGTEGDTVRLVNNGLRVVRGGCWNYPASSCRSANRFYHKPSVKSNYLGFRPILIWNPPQPSMEFTRRIKLAE
ncbi:formylglycine-generating enzyme family protein [Pontiellaceae bacterium B12219]|nr:formylglycine-generating enzyme family protein [Pontiellaceae bacterium B12219]